MIQLEQLRALQRWLQCRSQTEDTPPSQGLTLEGQKAIPRNLTTTSALVTTTHSHPALQFRHRTKEATHRASPLSPSTACPLIQASPQLRRVTSSPPDANEEPRRDRPYSKLEREERCCSPTLLNSPRKAEPGVQAEPTGPQDTIKNCLSFTHRAKTAIAQQHHCTCLQPHERGEAHLAQPSQGASYRSYNEEQGRPLSNARQTRLTT